MKFNTLKFFDIIMQTGDFLLEKGLIKNKPDHDKATDCAEKLANENAYFYDFSEDETNIIKLRLRYDPSWINQIYLYGRFKEFGTDWRQLMIKNFPNDYYFQFMLTNDDTERILKSITETIDNEIWHDVEYLKNLMDWISKNTIVKLDERFRAEINSQDNEIYINMNSSFEMQKNREKIADTITQECFPRKKSGKMITITEYMKDKEFQSILFFKSWYLRIRAKNRKEERLQITWLNSDHLKVQIEWLRLSNQIDLHHNSFDLLLEEGTVNNLYVKMTGYFHKETEIKMLADQVLTCALPDMTRTRSIHGFDNLYGFLRDKKFQSIISASGMWYLKLQ